MGAQPGILTGRTSPAAGLAPRRTGLRASPTDTTYTAQLRAARGQTVGTSASATATTRAEPPPAPTGLRATAGDAAIELSWTDPSDSAITGYQVRVSADGGATWSPDWTDISGSGAATTSHTLTNLANDTAYTAQLRASRGQTAGAAARATATPKAEPPPAPKDLQATPGAQPGAGGK